METGAKKEELISERIELIEVAPGFYQAVS